jgi:glycosyltransferase involved in cell wall biosynthesis
LAGAIESLCQQTIAPDRFEILVVDCAASNKAESVVQLLRVKYSGHLIRYFHEPEKGAGFARNMAYQMAEAGYIAYLDDDARADPKWLEVALGLIEIYAKPACLGGLIIPFYTTQKPDWFCDEYEARSWGDSDRQLLPDESFSGSNMIWRVDILHEIGGFGEEIGPMAGSFSIGEDTMAFKRFWSEKLPSIMIYSPDLRMHHWVPEFKMRVPYQLKRALVGGQSSIKMLGAIGLASRCRIFIRSLGAVTLHAVRAMWRIQRYPCWQNWAIEEGKLVLYKFGAACAAVGFYSSLERG